jgi:3-deoxy-manno-octulosonate cytidylyltransferase (CMP-KDO synthetase)
MPPAAPSPIPAERDRALGVIPARFGATRFPGKPLARLWGKPLIQHVWERARAIAGLDELVVATDDQRIAAVARDFGAAVEMTSPECGSGTDRAAEVAGRRTEAAIILNLQGDEPELDATAAATLLEAMRADPTIRMATLAHEEEETRVLASPDVVKVSVDPEGFARSFSRAAPPAGVPRRAALRHIGVYGFRREFLLEFAAWPPSESERRERLEQLRALDRGVRIRVIASARAAQGIDTPEQLAALEERGPRG